MVKTFGMEKEFKEEVIQCSSCQRGEYCPDDAKLRLRQDFPDDFIGYLEGYWSDERTAYSTQDVREALEGFLGAKFPY